MLEEKDIGKQLLRHLTSELYPEPYDAIREYIQNAIDAKAKLVRIDINKDEVIIEDDGTGMVAEAALHSIRLGVSDKSQKKDIGYKGIGIYSGLLVAKHLRLETCVANGEPQALEIDFASIDSDIEDDTVDSLLDLLNKNIELIKDATIKKFPKSGTRIILTGITKNAKLYFADIKRMEKYLEKTMPLNIDSRFEHKDDVEKFLERIGDTHRTIKLDLYREKSPQAVLYRPYSNVHESQPLKPFEIKLGDKKFGWAWGCMAVKRKRYSGPRGFLFKKHGVTIGTENTILKHFPQGPKFFDRYIGEFIILNKNIQPSASRGEILISEDYYDFITAVEKVAKKFEKHADVYQETNLAQEKIKKAQDILEDAKSENPLSDDTTIDLIKIREHLEKRVDNYLIEKETRVKLPPLIKEISEALSASGRESGDTTGGTGGPGGPGGTGGGAGGGTGGPEATNGITPSKKVLRKISDLNANSAMKEGAKKIAQLYNSLCIISLKKHPLVCYMAAVAFFEVLARIVDERKVDDIGINKYIIGKVDRDFIASNSSNKKGMKSAWDHIRAFGNEAKHSTARSPESANQLKTDMEVLEPLILKFFDDILEASNDEE